MLDATRILWGKWRVWGGAIAYYMLATCPARNHATYYMLHADRGGGQYNTTTLSTPSTSRTFPSSLLSQGDNSSSLLFLPRLEGFTERAKAGERNVAAKVRRDIHLMIEREHVSMDMYGSKR